MPSSSNAVPQPPSHSMENDLYYGAIILAGGKGTRFNGNKQFYDFQGKQVWKHVYDKISPILDNKNIVVVGVDVPGGKTRSESVKTGCDNLSSQTKRVIILEAARPLVTEEQIKTLLYDEHPSCTFVMPLVNTVIGRDGTYMNREDYYNLLTPQAFDYPLLKEAYESNLFPDMTDETRVMHDFHHIKPKFIEGGQNLIKITYISDLPILEHIAKQQETGKL